jgi:hypothetical protein
MATGRGPPMMNRQPHDTDNDYRLPPRLLDHLVSTLAAARGIG